MTHAQKIDTLLHIPDILRIQWLAYLGPGTLIIRNVAYHFFFSLFFLLCTFEQSSRGLIFQSHSHIDEILSFLAYFVFSLPNCDLEYNL
jgi:hypothetical protein